MAASLVEERAVYCRLLVTVIALHTGRLDLDQVIALLPRKLQIHSDAPSTLTERLDWRRLADGTLQGNSDLEADHIQAAEADDFLPSCLLPS